MRAETASSRTHRCSIARVDDSTVLAIERPHPRLLVYYVLRSMLVPFWLVVLPYHYFRYTTMRYRFDGEGVTMSWGVLFRREITLTYSRIQDIHLTSNFVQRWLGLANLLIQTAAASNGAEMTIEGRLEFEAIRDFLYSKMRGSRSKPVSASPSVDANAALVSALADVSAELRRAGEALARIGEKRS
jgi:putative membrane protein